MSGLYFLESCGRLAAKELRSVGDKQNAGWYVISTVVWIVVVSGQWTWFDVSCSRDARIYQEVLAGAACMLGDCNCNLAQIQSHCTFDR
jgi:hypothetical protein